MTTREEWVLDHPDARPRFYAKVEERDDGCHEWVGTRNQQGYGRFSRWEDGESVWVSAHRLTFTDAVRPIRDGFNICHTCDNPPCVNPDHLFEGTPGDNMRDMYRKQRGPDLRGERHGMAKLTQADADAIRKRYRPRVVTRRDLAKEFGVSKATIHRVLCGANWNGEALALVNRGQVTAPEQETV